MTPRVFQTIKLFTQSLKFKNYILVRVQNCIDFIVVLRSRWRGPCKNFTKTDILIQVCQLNRNSSQARPLFFFKLRSKTVSPLLFGRPNLSKDGYAGWSMAVFKTFQGLSFDQNISQDNNSMANDLIEFRLDISSGIFFHIRQLSIVYLAIMLYNDARVERTLSFWLGTGCMAAAVLLRNRRLRFTKLSPQIL